MVYRSVNDPADRNWSLSSPHNEPFPHHPVKLPLKTALSGHPTGPAPKYQLRMWGKRRHATTV